MKKIKLIFDSILFLMIVYSNVFAQTGKPQYQIRTERADTVLGMITIELFPAIAPLHSAYFDSLVNISFYDSTAFHRVDPGFVIQGGDPNSINGPKDTWGEGDSSQATILAEFSGVSHQRGIIGAARDVDINSASSQFYVNLADNNFLDWNYTAYGQVLDGMDVVDFISLVPAANEKPNEKIEMFISKTGFSNEIPLIPNLIQPIEGELGLLNSDSLRWEIVDGAVMYSFEISKSATFDSIYIQNEVGFNFHQLKELELGNIDFYWRVKAHNGGNVSEYSNIGHFVSSIKAPILVYPENNDDSISLAPEFRWLPVEGATKYRLQIFDALSFSDESLVFDEDTITATYHTPPPLQPNDSHYWQVYSMTDTYQGPKSEFRRFVTPDVTGINNNLDLPNEFHLTQNYPNPFNPNTTIGYDIPKQSNVKIVVYDLLGNSVKELINKYHQQGKYNIKFDGSMLSSGIYYYRIEAEGFVGTKKLVLLK